MGVHFTHVMFVFFPFKVNNYNGKKALAAQAVRHQLESGVRGFQVFFPGENAHINHPTGEVCKVLFG